MCFSIGDKIRKKSLYTVMTDSVFIQGVINAKERRKVHFLMR